MKKLIKKIAGVTLLEIMLVLAIASLVVVMSIRYYTNAQNSENVNLILDSVTNITAAMDSLSTSQGTYSNNSAGLTNTVGASNMTTPYGGTIKLVAATGATYTIAIPLPGSVCYQVAARLKNNSKYTSPLCSSNTVTYTYNWSS